MRSNDAYRIQRYNQNDIQSLNKQTEKKMNENLTLS